MQNKLFIFLAVITASVLFACENDSVNTTQTEPEVDILDTLGFGTVSFKEISKSCATDTMQCAKVEISYPLARGGEQSVYETINTRLQKEVAAQVGVFGEESADSIQLSPQEVAKAFVQDYDNYVKEEDMMARHGWSSETEGKILYKGKGWITIELNTYAYTGGAHPNYYTRLLNFDPQTGNLIEPIDYVSDTTTLKKIVEAAFRIERDIASDTDLNSEGFWFEKGFTLPNEIGMTADSMIFIYNSYEVAPYVMGMTEINISKKELAGTLKK